ncbi:MAG: bifunctional precorrin-2 dehydrogenase/sirohydrochlorin ferrochelatase [Candidatus Hatepunaea meridiana]|nr:bifunctional precorrin-2 dehydrogenase/sirohydrochlorin ferrochelatase [Candidatus Hatepunaea meridiana]
MYLPLLFNTDTMNCLIVGGGKVALRKVEVLLDAGCKVKVISPDVISPISDLVKAEKIAYNQREYQNGDCNGMQLVISATENTFVNMQVSEDAGALNIPVNVVDVPELCTVIFPAIYRDEPLIVAVSTGGEAPFMAQELRNRVEKTISKWSRWVIIARRFRKIVLQNTSIVSEKRAFYRKFIQAGIPPDNVNPPDDDILDNWLKWLKNLSE